MIPAHNEARTITPLIEYLEHLELKSTIIVVDDGSKDDTATLASLYGVTVISHERNLGQWAALRTGFYRALSSGAEAIIAIDSDGQNDPAYVPDLLRPVKEKRADFVIGSRFMNGTRPEMPIHRYVGIRTFNVLIRLLTHLKLSDCTSGYRAYSARLLTELLPTLKENQYGALEAVIKSAKLGARILEVPVPSIKASKSSKGSLRYWYNLTRVVVKSSFFHASNG